MEEDTYRPADSVYYATDIVFASPSRVERRGFSYFKNKKLIQTSDLNVEAYFNEVSEDEFGKIQQRIVNCVSNFKDMFGLKKLYYKKTLEAYFFNNKEEYARLGTSSNFTDSFGLTLQPKTHGMSSQSPYMLFVTKDDMDTLSHEMAHALNYHAVAFRAHCLWDAFIEGLADYFELLYNEASPTRIHSHIKHTFDVMVNIESRIDTLDEIKEVLSSNRRVFHRLNVNMYSIGYSLVTYLQERNSTFIKDFFYNVCVFDHIMKACEHCRKVAVQLHNEHDLSFKEWVRNKYDILDNKLILSSNLHEAAELGEINRVKEFINEGTEVNSVDEDGCTPLHCAVRGYQVEVVKLLLDKGANINAKENHGWTVLHFASCYESIQLDLASLLIEKRADIYAQTDADWNYNDRHYKNGSTPIDVADVSGKREITELLSQKQTQMDSGWSPLHYAAEHGNKKLATFMIENGANIEAKDKFGRLPIHISAQAGHKNIIDLFLQNGQSVNYPDAANGWTPLHHAIGKGEIELSKYLLDKGANINAKENFGWTVLHFACYFNTVQLELAALLIEKGGDILAKTDAAWEDRGRYYKKGSTPLDVATISGKIELASLLNEMQTQEDPGWSLLHYASKHGNKELAISMIENGANVKARDKSGRLPIHIAAEEGNKNIIELFLQKGISINCPDAKNGWTPLHCAIGRGEIEFIEFLLDKGADINAKENYGWTVLHFACYFPSVQLKLASLLIEKGGDIYGKTIAPWEDRGRYYKEGSTPLDVANISGKLELVDLLREKQIQENSGWSPLHYAAQHGNKELAIFMIEHGADIDAKDKDSRTPLNVAFDQKYEDIATYLEEIKIKRMEAIVKRKRRHDYGYHRSRYNLSSRTLLASDLIKRNNQSHNSTSTGTQYVLEDSPQQYEISYIKRVATSGASKQPSWISDFFSWVKYSSRKFFGSRIVSSITENGLHFGLNLSDVARNPSNQHINQYSTEVCMNNNIALVYLLLQNFLDKKYPLPWFCAADQEEVLASTLEITGKFEETINKMAKQFSKPIKDFDFFKVHLSVANQIRNERNSKIPNILYSAAKEIFQENGTILSIYKGRFEDIVRQNM